MNNTVSATTAGYTLAAASAVIANTLLVWAKESNPALLAFMKTFIHHWLIHGVVIVALFVVLGVIFSRWSMMRRFNGTFLAVVLGLSTIAAGAGIAGYYLIIG